MNVQLLRKSRKEHESRGLARSTEGGLPRPLVQGLQAG